MSLRQRLPASLDSLKPAVFSGTWYPDLILVPTSEADERKLMDKLIQELNCRFDVNLDRNYSTCRDVVNNSDAEDMTDSSGQSYILVGSSHAYRMSAAFTNLGEATTCLASPFWRLNAENVATTSSSISELVAQHPDAVIVYQLFDSSVYFSSSEEGEVILPKRGEDGRYHVVGDLTLADWHVLKKLFNTALPLLRAGGKNKKIILSPLPRYISSKCCILEGHLTNFGGKNYAKMMGKSLADIHEWLDDLAHGKRLQHYKVFCPSTAIGLDDSASIKDKTGLLELKKRWGEDPVHLTPTGYTMIAEAISNITQEETEKAGAAATPKPQVPAERRLGLSRSDLTASRWESAQTRTSNNEQRGSRNLGAKRPRHK